MENILTNPADSCLASKQRTSFPSRHKGKWESVFQLRKISTQKDTHPPLSHLTGSVDTRTSLIGTDVFSFLKIYFNLCMCVCWWEYILWVQVPLETRRGNQILLAGDKGIFKQLSGSTGNKNQVLCQHSSIFLTTPLTCFLVVDKLFLRVFLGR